ncbi:MFS transporter [Kitasatospora sp. NPDC051853]|uniref:MFS transporter n=1 Tax=Kitasatospora sp. NPDC051853 TaxID=3364058 RepID=UPI00378A65B9
MASSGTPLSEQTDTAPEFVKSKAPTLTGRLRFFLVSSFLLPLGSFMVLPFMSVYLHQRLGLGLGLVGLVIGTASLVQFSGGMAGALVAERLGLRRTMLLGLTVRSSGFALFAVSPLLPPLAVAALLLTAAGDAFYTPANKAYLVEEAGPERRPLVLSLTNSALNTGMALGPLISGTVILTAPVPVFTATAVIFAGIAVAHALLLPADRPGPADPGQRREVLLKALLRPPMLAAAAGAYVYMFFQNYLVVYLADHHSTGVYSLLLLLNTVLVIVVQPPASRWIGALPFRRAMLLSFGAFALGLGLLGVHGLLGIVAGTVLVSLGEVVVFLRCDLAALDSLPDRPAAAVGTLRMAQGLGALASGVVGGQLYALTSRDGGGTPWFWLLVAVQGLALAAGSALVRRRRGAGSAGGAGGAGALEPV